MHQAGARSQWDSEKGAFVTVDLPAHLTAVGEVTGESLVAPWPLPPERDPTNKRAFVCLCSDVSSQDLANAVAEGFDHIETLKRYTTTTMGPCQGRMCQLPAIGVCARETRRSMGETGTTTSRPPNPGVTLGALAGARHHPIRRTPFHYEHEESGAVWLDMGEWKRPRYYKTQKSSEERVCVEEEYRAVRERVGLIDVSTLGKLDLRGRDVGKLLDKIYVGRLSDLRPGRVRYGVLCDEAGIMLDDGTVSRLADDHYFITTTTGNLDFVDQWMKWWLVGTGWDVHITNLTGGLAAVNLAGPNARDVLSQLTDCDLSTQGFSLHGVPQRASGWSRGHFDAHRVCRRNGVGDPLSRRVRSGPVEGAARSWGANLIFGRSGWKPNASSAWKSGTSSWVSIAMP